MSLRLEMLQVARLAKSVLGEAGSLIEAFVLGSQQEDGGFCDRDGKSDLYYTSFAIDSLTALQVELPHERIAAYLDGFGEGEGLDFVHLCCLARCWSAIQTKKIDPDVLDGVLDRIEEFRTEEGGYEQSPTAAHGSCYGCLLAYGANADHQKVPPNLDGLAKCLDNLRTTEGAWANDTNIPIGSGPATAAAITLCRNLRHPISTQETTNALMQCFDVESGGFKAIPNAPMPDLLSTAVILHALDGLQAPLEKIKESCLDYVDTLWTNEGGFYGTWAEDTLDVEYTYYGLLALGHLAL
ncbi:MAG: prenyltransferase/squalene oxidase repeat-containing protein [Verrucomicrobiota bacterium]